MLSQQLRIINTYLNCVNEASTTQTTKTNLFIEIF